MSFVPGMGILKGMALTFRKFFAPKVTIRYPEVTPDIAVKYRGRLQLLYDEHGTLKCETCFQCAQACPIECIDMGGSDTKGRYAVHWGASETYGERREEAALRRSGREVPDPTYARFEPVERHVVVDDQALHLREHGRADRHVRDDHFGPRRSAPDLRTVRGEAGREVAAPGRHPGPGEQLAHEHGAVAAAARNHDALDHRGIPPGGSLITPGL